MVVVFDLDGAMEFVEELAPDCRFLVPAEAWEIRGSVVPEGGFRRRLSRPSSAARLFLTSTGFFFSIQFHSNFCHFYTDLINVDSNPFSAHSLFSFINFSSHKFKISPIS